MFLKKKKVEIDFSRLPKHVAFIMDGNGRWAKKRGMPRTYGHKVGIDALNDVIDRSVELGLQVVSFYAFSTENWNRPKEEIDEIFRLVRQYLGQYKKKFIEKNIKLMVVGGIERFPKDLVDELNDTLEKTKNNSGLIVNLALNYGGRTEIVEAVNNIIKDGLKAVDEKTFTSYLQTASIPDPDFVVRTSGEQRLSNFMMFQSAYAELYFPKVCWPDYRAKELDESIVEYQKRDRRFGGLNENKKDKKRK